MPVIGVAAVLNVPVAVAEVVKIVVVTVVGEVMLKVDDAAVVADDSVVAKEVISPLVVVSS